MLSGLESNTSIIKIDGSGLSVWREKISNRMLQNLSPALKKRPMRFVLDISRKFHNERGRVSHFIQLDLWCHAVFVLPQQRQNFLAPFPPRSNRFFPPVNSFGKFINTRSYLKNRIPAFNLY